MSLSDQNDGFKPLDLSALETFPREVSHRTEVSSPDYERFKLLFEPSRFKKTDSSAFEALYEGKQDAQEVVFKYLVEPGDKQAPQPAPKKAKPGPAGDATPVSEGMAEPVESPEEKGYRVGFEKGMALGMDQGRTRGYEDGLAKGEARGAEQGEAHGREQGYAKGYEEGLAKGETLGREEIREKASQILETLEQALSMVDRTVERLVDIYEERIIALIRQIAEKAVMARLEVDDGIVRAMILEALKTLTQPEDVVLNVSEQDYEYIEMIREDFFETIKPLKSVSVQSDPSIRRGGCRIETKTAAISSDPLERLQAVFEAMKQAGH